MFGISIGSYRSGYIRDMEEELREKDRRIEEYEKLFAGLAVLKEESGEYFKALRDGRTSMDKSLTSVVDYVHEGGELASEGNVKAAELEKELDSKFNLTVGEAVELYRNNTRKDYTAALQKIIRQAGYEETY